MGLKQHLSWFDDPKLLADMAKWVKTPVHYLRFSKTSSLPLSGQQPKPEVLSEKLSRMVDLINEIQTLSSTIGSYLYAITSTDSFNKAAEQLSSKFQISLLPLQNVIVRMQVWLGKMSDQLPAALAIPGSAHNMPLHQRTSPSKPISDERS